MWWQTVIFKVCNIKITSHLQNVFKTWYRIDYTYISFVTIVNAVFLDDETIGNEMNIWIERAGTCLV